MLNKLCDKGDLIHGDLLERFCLLLVGLRGVLLTRVGVARDRFGALASHDECVG